MLNKRNHYVFLLIFTIFTLSFLHQTVKAQGAIAPHWQPEGSSWNYIDSYGSKTTGWLRWDGSYYYLDSQGAMAEGWKLINSKWYYFKPGSGVMASGWLNYEGKWYYMDYNNGSMTSGMVMDGIRRYWMNPEGDMAKGWKNIQDKWYYFNKISGEMVTGWIMDRGNRYYLYPENGAMAIGWIKDRGSWYYLNSNGSMASNATVNGHYLGIDGTWQRSSETLWSFLNGKWYYLSPLGEYDKGWVPYKGSWYYLNPVSGEMVTGWVFDGGKWYFMKDDGAMALNTIIDGYELGADGAWRNNAAPEEYMVTLGSSDKDVLSVMLEPSNTGIGSPLLTYFYNNSKIYLLDDGEDVLVAGWDNKDNNLKVTLGAKSANYFSLGASKEEVAGIMGTPKVIDPHSYHEQGRWTYWEYEDGSRISFDGNEKVNGWNNKGSLRVTLGDKDPAAPSVNLGSSLRDVVRVMGTPTSLEADPKTNLPEKIYYGDTCISLGSKTTVTGWSNKDIYDIKMGDRDPGAPPIWEGCTLSDVVRAMGTPDEVIQGSESDSPYMLKYGNSTVYMNITTGLVEKWINEDIH